MRRHGILCPEVVHLRKHVLVMTFVGADGKAAKPLKEAPLTEEELISAYGQCLALMERLYGQCGLVHADLSEYNLLWHEQHVFAIDVSQSVFVTHPMAFKFLWRDCVNITRVTHVLFVANCQLFSVPVLRQTLFTRCDVRFGTFFPNLRQNCGLE